MKNQAKKGWSLPKAIRGTLVVMKRVCGKKNCRCVKGPKHESFYLSQSVKGKTKMIYIPRESETKAHQYVENYRNLKKQLEKISQENIKKLVSN